MSSLRRAQSLLGTGVIALLLFACGVSQASAAPPEANWGLSAVPAPTNFNYSDSRKSIIALTVTATSGTYELETSQTTGATAPIPWDASAAELEAILEATPSLGASGNLQVSGGPGDGSGSKPYVITWGGRWNGIAPGSMSAANSTLKTGSSEGSVASGPVQTPAAFDSYVITATNRGDGASQGDVTVTDELPAAVTAIAAEVIEPITEGSNECAVARATPGTSVTCTYPASVRPEGELLVQLTVAVADPKYIGAGTNVVRLTNAGAVTRTLTKTSGINTGDAPFGIDEFAFEATGANGLLDGASGSHPDGVTTVMHFNTDFFAQRSSSGEPVGSGSFRSVVQDVRRVTVELPQGFVGDPLATERCPLIDLTDGHDHPDGGNFHSSCPSASQVGRVRFEWQGGGHPEPVGFPVYNMVPERGYPAELGINASLSQPILLYATVVPTSSGYRLQVSAPDALRPGDVALEGVSLTIFGDPSAHNGSQGSTAFVTNPTRCSNEALGTKLEITSWEGGNASSEVVGYPAVDECNLLQGSAAFSPTITVSPETTTVDAPAGYEFDVKLPQAPAMFGQTATPALKDATVTLPAGVSLNPAAASGAGSAALSGCTAAQIDLGGTEVGEGHPGGDGSAYDDGLLHATPGRCPESSRIGTVEITTPLLPEPLHGNVFLAQPSCGGEGQPVCTEQAAEEGGIFGIYFEATGSGVTIKLHGSVEVGGHGKHSADTGLALGQVRTRFLENPQLPVEDVKLKLADGPRAQLANPQSCGLATTTSEFEPWSAPASGPNATPSSTFAVTGCPASQPFTPGFAAGTIVPAASEFSPFTLTLSRNDGEQSLSAVGIQMPPGLVGAVSAVPRCQEPQASSGACSAESLIGHVQVAAGAGTLPLWVTGSVYLTGPYGGGPFGLTIVTPAKAGPFNLGNVVTRAAIHVDPKTAAVSVVSDPLPLLIDGLPLRLKAVNVTIDRPGFILNPSSCTRQSINGSATGALPSGATGTVAPVASGFGTVGCRSLRFAPTMAASTSARTSKASGASLHVRLTSGLHQANLGKVKVSLPVQLPSRLTTLQKACPVSVFNANPAACPPGSVIGTGTAVTPLLKSPLTGPAYLVSHAALQFPDQVFVLQGEGVTVELEGHTKITKGITSASFEAVPDVPVTSFDAVFPEGPHSILAANANLCKTRTKLNIPYVLTGQNGALLKQTAKIAVSGCPKAKKKAKKKRKRTKKKRKRSEKGKQRAK